MTPSELDQPAPTARASAPPAELPEWVPNQSTRNKALAEGAVDGVVLDGIRVSLDGRARAPMVAKRALSGLLRGPGGTHWFFARDALYRARGFFEPLEPVLRLPSAVSQLSAGPDFLLLHMSEAGVLVVDQRTGGITPPPVLGLFDVATLPDGRALALADPGRVFYRAAASTSWKDVSAAVHGNDARVERHDGSLWIVTDTDGFRLEADGELTRHALPPRSIARYSGWRHAREAPLDHAVARGWRIDQATALTIADGSVVRVNLGDGRVVEASEPVFPRDSQCELTLSAGELVAACRTGRGLFVATNLLGTPKVERTFGSTGYLLGGEGVPLAFAGPCGDAPVVKLRVCVRVRSGTWREVAPPAAPTAPDASVVGALSEPDLVKRIVIDPEGAAFGLVLGPAPGLLDIAKGHLQPFTSDGWRQITALFSVPGNSVLVDAVTIERDRTVRGYLDRRAFALSADGELQSELHSFGTLVSRGARALALEQGGTAWQSVDHGRTFTAVHSPAESAPRPSNCSHVGCTFTGGWHRLGWRHPSAREEPAIAPEPAPMALPRLPRLACAPTGDMAERVVSPRVEPESDADLDALELGARRVPIGRAELELITSALSADSSEATRVGFMRSRAELDDRALVAEFARPRSLRFVPPFQAAAVVEQASFSWLGLANRVLIPPDRLLDHDDSEVLVIDGSTPELGFVMDGVLLSLAPRRPLEAHVLPLDDDVSQVVGLTRSAGTLLALLTGSDCLTRIQALNGRLSQTRMALPSRSQSSCGSQALGTRGSELAVIRLSGSLPPSANTPAYALSAAGIERLADWSTLTPASAPECQAMNGYRTLLTIPERWLDVHLVGTRPSSDDLLVASVTWSAERLCVHALEAAAAALTIAEEEVPSRVVARFSDKPAAARIAVAPGVEAQQALSCRLQ